MWQKKCVVVTALQAPSGSICLPLSIRYFDVFDFTAIFFGHPHNALHPGSRYLKNGVLCYLNLAMWFRQVGVVRQAESAALKAAGLTESGKKSGTFKRELAAVFSQVGLESVMQLCRRRGFEERYVCAISHINAGGVESAACVEPDGCYLSKSSRRTYHDVAGRGAV